MKSLSEEIKRATEKAITKQMVEIADIEFTLSQIPRGERDDETKELLKELAEEFDRLFSQIEYRHLPHNAKTATQYQGRGDWVLPICMGSGKAQKGIGQQGDPKERVGLTRWAGYLLYQEDIGFGDEAVAEAKMTIESRDKFVPKPREIKRIKGRDDYLLDENGRIIGWKE